MAKKKNNQVVPQNRSASIRTREDRRGNMRTETFRRDDDTVSVAVSTNPRNESTRLFIDTPEGQSYSFDGRTARTVYRALQKHYRETNRTY
jgi:hypothetical protein